MTTKVRTLRPAQSGPALDAYGTPVPPPDTPFWARLVSKRGYDKGTTELGVREGDCVYVICCDCGDEYNCGLMRAVLQPPATWPEHDDCAMLSLFDLEYLPNGPVAMDYTNVDEGGVV